MLQLNANKQAFAIFSVKPVFTVLVLGFVLDKTYVVSRGETNTLSRMVFILLQPPLIFLPLSQVNLAKLRYLAILSYVGELGLIMQRWWSVLGLNQ